jgi:hypothetical protein
MFLHSAWSTAAELLLHLPFAILSDEHLALTGAMKLPTFQTSGIKALHARNRRRDNNTCFLPRFSARPERRRRC